MEVDKLPPKPESKVCSVPRRYDLATMFAVTVAYSMLFGVMRLFELRQQAMFGRR